uniref:Retrotransposon protein, putative, Ty1-copia subclass n=1 Tax=Tanacetum cinerariifolium TaxID=118510 RepID=A0A6L2J5U0_TANCI|nr:retrotransposon protein, putative, Ty1-copia subclass [Tanacetum cinerariifolium]
MFEKQAGVKSDFAGFVRNYNMHNMGKTIDELHALLIEKTIKALRPDRVGGYISQEFKDYLKACRIVQQLTPLYTPQHNGVSKRRNHTLLDMVGSMMNLTTLPLSFCDYAIDSATHILNMVLTKKVDKTLEIRLTNSNKEIQKVSRRAVEHEEIQDEDISPSENNSEIPMEVEGFEPPQEEVIPFRRTKQLIGLSQSDYMDKILKRFKMQNYKRGNIPMQERFNLNKTQGASTPEEVKRMQNVPYASAMESIMYAVRCTRPNVAFA